MDPELLRFRALPTGRMAAGVNGMQPADQVAQR